MSLGSIDQIRHLRGDDSRLTQRCVVNVNCVGMERSRVSFDRQRSIEKQSAQARNLKRRIRICPMDHRTSSLISRSPATRNTPGKPPFQLCFPKDQLLGTSSIRLPNVYGNSMTPKFYSREYEDARDLDLNVDDTLEEKNSRKDAYQWPLPNHLTYGWWYERGIQAKQSPLNFHKQTSDLVNFQMKIYADDRKLKVYNH